MTAATLLRTVPSYRGFRPTDIANLKFWAKAEGMDLADAASVGGTTLWPDESGLGNNGAEGSAGFRPTFINVGQGGRPTIRFDGGDRLNSTPGSLNQPNTVIIVFKSSTTSGSPRVFDNASGGQEAIFINAGVWTMYAGTAVASAVALDTNPHVMLAVFNGASSLLRLDGVQIAAGNAGAAAAGNLRFGGSVAGTNNFSGDIPEGAVYNAALAVGDQQTLERWLGGKYGFAVA